MWYSLGRLHLIIFHISRAMFPGNLQYVIVILKIQEPDYYGPGGGGASSTNGVPAPCVSFPLRKMAVVFHRSCWLVATVPRMIQHFALRYFRKRPPGLECPPASSALLRRNFSGRVSLSLVSAVLALWGTRKPEQINYQSLC